MGGGDETNNGHLRVASDLANELAKANRDLNTKVRTLKDSQDALRLINVQVNEGIVAQMKAARDGALALAEAEKKASFLGQTQSFLAGKLGESTAALQKFNAESLKINWGGSDGEKLIKQAERRLALSKKEGDERQRLQATYDAEDAGVVDPKAIAKLQEVYVKTNQAKEATKDKKKEDREAAAESKKAASQAERNTRVLDEYRQKADLSADSTSGLSREQAILAAKLKLTNPTPQQISQIEKDAAAAWDKAAALKAQSAVPELKENADYAAQKSQLEMIKAAKDAQGNLLITQQQYSQQSEQLEQQHQANLAKIRADQVVTPQQAAAGTVDPVQQLANENAQKLALIQQFENQKVLTEQQSLALRNSLNTQYDQQRTAAMWTMWRNQSVGNEAVAASFDSLAGNASNAFTGMVTGSMTAEEAMSSLASNAINSLINSFVQMGVEWVKSAVMGSAAQTNAVATTTAASVAGTATTTAASTTAAGVTLAAWTPAALVASIGSFGGAAVVGLAALLGVMALSGSIAGKRKNGGPVSAGSMYQVGEGGMPEIYRASNGSQYMIPGDNGSVISNKDLSSGGGGQIQVSIQFNDYTTGSHTYDAQATQSGNSVTVQAFIMDMNQGGPMSQSITNNLQAPRKARE